MNALWYVHGVERLLCGVEAVDNATLGCIASIVKPHGVFSDVESGTRHMVIVIIFMNELNPRVRYVVLNIKVSRSVA